MSAFDVPVAAGLLDSQNMFGATASLPEQFEDAAERARSTENLPRAKDVSAIVVLGMGGSGVAGHVLEALGAPRLSVPVVCVNSYEVPTFVGPSTLVFAVSFSGETEETITGSEIALARGAHFVAISGEGSLAELARSNHKSVIGIAPGIPQPRAGLGATLAPLLVACEEIGLAPGMSDAIEKAVEQLRRRRPELIARSGGIASEIAKTIGRGFPLVYGAAGIGSVAARRWKTQVNENAKAPAFSGEQPEVCHNEICGFGQNGDVTRQLVTLCYLRSQFEHPRVGARFSLMSGALREAVGAIVEVHASGDGPLAQLMDLIFIGDFVSLHMAVAEGIDPGPVPVLVGLKHDLATWDG